MYLIIKRFQKKAKGMVKFHCTQGAEAFDAVNKAIETGQAVTLKLKSVGTDASGDIVSEFEFEWSLKEIKMNQDFYKSKPHLLPLCFSFLDRSW